MGKGSDVIHPANPTSNAIVYVIDDHLAMCESIDALLSSHGFSVECFTNALDFVKQLEKLPRGIVLLDLRMPAMSGHDVLAAMKGHLRRFPVIMMTGHGEIEDAVKAIKSGAKNFVQKPFRDNALLDAVLAEQEYLCARRANKNGEQALAMLSPRERDVVIALAQGRPNKVIAHDMGLSVRTVEMHRARAMSRLGCRTFADLLRIILSNSDIDLSQTDKLLSSA